MTRVCKKYISDWKDISELRPIDADISNFSYSMEFINANGLHDKKVLSCSADGCTNFVEPIEVKEEAGKVYFRENDDHLYKTIPKVFKTQFGTFVNHYNGEYTSWIHRACRQYDFLIEGNYLDMFDCGKYVYAVSNEMHMSAGKLKIVRIDAGFQSVNLFDNSFGNGWTRFKFEGRIRHENGYIIVVDGFDGLNQWQNSKKSYSDRLFLLQIDSYGNCKIYKDWKAGISFSNSIAKCNRFIYFGQNKMVTRINFLSGEVAYFTNRNDQELSDLQKMWQWHRKTKYI